MATDSQINRRCFDVCRFLILLRSVQSRIPKSSIDELEETIVVETDSSHFRRQSHKYACRTYKGWLNSMYPIIINL